MEIKSNTNRKNYNLSINMNNIKMSNANIKTGEIEEKSFRISEYKSKDCFKNKCSKEEDYIGYLIFLKDKINSYEKNV